MRTAEAYLEINGILVDGLKSIHDGQLYKNIISAINLAREEAIRECAMVGENCIYSHINVAPNTVKQSILNLINQLK